MPLYFQKPENALKRANEFVDVGTKEAALDVLYDVIKSKKHRNWQKIHDPILKLYLSLCVELKRSVSAKEGLYQYKLICQQVNIACLEDIVRYFLKLAEDTAENARNQSKEKVLVEDLDQLKSPEDLLLSSVSAEGTQDRTDRVLLTPWVKFLWEAYRNVLDLLRNNNRVERLYQDTAQQAFKFCLKYTRRAEFKKLCDHIRNHLGQILKYQGQPNAINLNNAESLQMHLETRLSQLESAIKMELWQEAFKAIEDIHSLMQLSKKPPKPHVLANYYEKMSLVFWKAGNHQFHAAALHRLFVLYKEQKKSISQEETQKISTKVLLATLSVPISSGKSELEEYLNYDDTAHEKAKRLSGLLGLQTIPSRAFLVKEMLKINVLSNVIPEISTLYSSLEEEFQPMKLCKKVHTVLEFLQEQEDYKQYVQSLREITTVRMLKQVSQIYDRMKFSKLTALVPFLNEHELERIIVDSVKGKDLQLSIDQRQRFVSFGSTLVVAMREEVPEGPFVQSMKSENTRNQLCMLSQGLQKSVLTIRPEIIKKDRGQQRETLVQQYLRQERKEHSHILNRRSVIEARKEMIESMKNKLEKQEQAKIHQQHMKLKVAEEKRLEEERARREEERKQQEYAKVKKQQVMERVKTLTETDVGKKAFKGLTSEQIEDMNEDDIIRIQVEQLDKEKRELSVKMKTQEKKIDFMARAMKREEIPLLEKKHEEDAVQDKIIWEQQEEEKVASAMKDHEVALATKTRLEKMLSEKENFVKDLSNKRKDTYEVSQKSFEERCDNVRKERLEERRKQRIAERKSCYIKEKKEAAEKIEEERLRKEKEEEEQRLAVEREARLKEEEEKNKKLAEIERKKQEREREIEEKLRQKEQDERDSRARDAGPPANTESRDAWRRKPEAREQPDDAWRRGGSSDAQPPSREQPPARDAGGRSRYVPPSMRRGESAESDREPSRTPSEVDRDPRRRRDDGFSGRGDSDRGGRSDGDRSYGGRSEGDRSYGGRGDDRGYGRRSDGERSFGGRSDGDRSYGARGEGDRGYSGRSDGDRGYGGRGDGDRGYGARGDGDRGYGGRGDDERRGGGGDGGGGGGGAWRDGGDGNTQGGNWRRDEAPRDKTEGRSWQASRVGSRTDRERPERSSDRPSDRPADRPSDRPAEREDGGWTTVGR